MAILWPAFWGALASASLLGSLYLLVAAMAVRRFRAPAQGAAAAAGAPATILKPLHGADWGLRENLRSFCDQHYPEFQLVCGVANSGDAAIAVVEGVRRERPGADLEVVVDPRVHGTNRKVSNLENMMARAKHDLLVIADSDMRVDPGYLAAVTAPLAEPAVGLVTCLYVGIPRPDLWSRLGAMHVNFGFLPSAVVNELLHPGDATFGATMALRRATLDAIGGFPALRDQLADDYALGAAVRRLGRRIVLSRHLVATVVDEPGFAALFRHELRWARTIRLIAPAGYAASIVTQPLALALLAALASGFALPAAAALAVALAARIAMVRLLERALAVAPASLFLLPARDLLSFAVFVASFCGRSIAWRDRRFRLLRDGRLVLDGDIRT